MSYADAPARRKRTWWIGPLGFLIVVFVAFSLPPYLTGDPARSRVPANPALPGQFWFLVVHVVFGSVALFAGAAQVWPWLRQRHPAWHRRLGRVYIFGGALPASISALVLAVFTPFGPVAGASSIILAVLWFGTTLAGWRTARRRRFREHRRWMIRSYVLSASIISNRIWGVLIFVVIQPALPDAIRNDPTMLSWTIAGMTTWLGWVIPLVVAEWYLERTPKRARGMLPEARGTAVPEAA